MVLPPSDEGGGFCEAKDGRREKTVDNISSLVILSLSFANAQQPLTAAVSLCHFVTFPSHREGIYPRQREPRDLINRFTGNE